MELEVLVSSAETIFTSDAPRVWEKKDKAPTWNSVKTQRLLRAKKYFRVLRGKSKRETPSPTPSHAANTQGGTRP